MSSAESPIDKKPWELLRQIAEEFGKGADYDWFTAPLADVKNFRRKGGFVRTTLLSLFLSHIHHV